MKLAATTANGIQASSTDKIRFYFVVADDYDFVGNNCIDVSPYTSDGCEDICLFYKIGRLDFKQLRAWLMVYAATIGFSLLSSEHKVLVAKHFAVSATDQLSIFTMTELDRYADEYHDNSVECRKARMKRAEAFAFSRLQTADRLAVVRDLKNEALRSFYIDLGQEGTSEGDNDSMYDYIEATGIFAEGNPVVGLAAKGISPTLGSLEQLVNGTMDILKGLVPL